MLRTFLALTLALILNCVCRSQQTAITRDHHCEGESPCSDAPACASAWRPYVSAVFLGRAFETRTEDVPIVLDGKKALTDALYVKFDVEESFRGVAEKSVTVVSGGDLCGFPFSKGHEYLVYGRRLESGLIYVSICAGTKWKKEAAEDLEYLRGLPTAPHGATVYGTAFRYREQRNPRYPMALRPGTAASGQVIEVHGPDRNYKVSVDAQGKFAISQLPPGRYTVVLESDEKVISNPPHLSTTVELADKGCARFSFWIDPFAEKDSEIQRGSNTSPAGETPSDEYHK